MDDQEMLRFFECLEKEPLQYKALITLLVYSGMRRGEVCGLQWKDIDFKIKSFTSKEPFSIRLKKAST